MNTYDSLEGNEYINASKEEVRQGLSCAESEYINECVEGGNPLALIERIDELQDSVPPKAINSNAEIANLIEPVRDQIDSKYLEAPSDFEQVERASDAMLDIEGTRYEEWNRMTPSQRLEAMQKVENTIAQISHRPPCEVVCKDMKEDHFGYYDSNTKTITLNSYYLKNDITSYRETLDTIVHEGRHAYQDYNLTVRQVHCSPGDLTNWRINENKYGYQSSQIYGFKLYWMQPVEADARKFAEDVFKKLNEKIV